MIPTRMCYVTYGMATSLEPVMVKGVLTYEREEHPCVVSVYSQEKKAKAAVEKNQAALAEMVQRMRGLRKDKLHAFLASAEAAALDSQITGEEWYEAVPLRI